MQKRYYIKTGAANPQPVHSSRRSSSTPLFFVWFFVVLLLVIAALTGLYFLGKQSSDQDANAVLPTSIPSVAPTATPTPTLSRKDMRITVLNGSGVAGSAQKVSSYLQGIGYTIDATGNAGIFTHRGITIEVSKENEPYVALLTKDLTGQFGQVSATVSATARNSVRVIVGR